jgi:hypothetical protein
VCKRRREEEDGATMKESGRHWTTVSTRNEYQAVHCVVVLDSAEANGTRTRKRLGRNKNRNASSCPRSRDQIDDMEGKPSRYGYIGGGGGGGVGLSVRA